MGIVSSNISLQYTNDTYGTTISYVSSDTNILSNTGLFNRPYQASVITYNVKIIYGSNSKTVTYEVKVEGFKELTNIAATYIGGTSSTYTSLSDNLFSTCDIITCGFAYPGIDGTFTNSNVNTLNFTHYLPKMKQYVIPNAHKKGTWVVLSVAGMSEHDSTIETICSSDALINTFVDNIVDLINTYGFDGVDIDWEVPSDGALFTKLMSKLYTAVKANNENHLVTAAIGGGKWNPAYYDLTNSCQYIDYINMMTYNMSTSSGYHHTPLYGRSGFTDSANYAAGTLTSCSVDESVTIFNNYGVDSSKLIIGSGFYGIVQKRSSLGLDWEESSNPSYTTIVTDYLSDTANYTYYYDDVCQVPYLISSDRLTFISYENATSVKAKCNYAIDLGLAGVFAWQYGLDNGDLLNAFKEGLSK